MTDSQDDLDFDNEDDGSGGDADAPQTPPASNSDSRVNELMSKWQSEQSRANKAEAELAALRAKAEGSGKGDGAPAKPKEPEAPAADNGFLDLVRDNARDVLYRSEPRLAQYGIEATSITGNTADEMKASFQKQIELVNQIETNVRNATLAEHGLVPEVGGGGGGKPVDYGSMDKDEFEKVVQRALNGR